MCGGAAEYATAGFEIVSKENSMPSAQGRAYKGSQKWLQILVNDCPELLNREIAEQSPVSAQEIHWLSPIRECDYKEYSGQEFIERLGIRLEKRPLEAFWPQKGRQPHWDGLGKTDKRQILLVEAKSHVKELRNTTGAAEPSLSRIRSSLIETKLHIHQESEPAIDWTTGVYQYANRLAHLYLLHNLNGLDAYLVLLYFLNDNKMQARDTFVPSTVSEWESVITYQERLMGIRQRHPLSNHIIHAFIDVNDIEANR